MVLKEYDTNSSSPFLLSNTFTVLLNLIEKEEDIHAVLRELELTKVNVYYETYEAVLKKYPYVGESTITLEVYSDGDFSITRKEGVGAFFSRTVKKFNYSSKQLNEDITQAVRSLLCILRSTKEGSMGFYEAIDSMATDVEVELEATFRTGYTHQQVVDSVLLYFIKGDMVSYLPTKVRDFLKVRKVQSPDIRALLLARALEKFVNNIKQMNFPLYERGALIGEEPKAKHKYVSPILSFTPVWNVGELADKQFIPELRMSKDRVEEFNSVVDRLNQITEAHNRRVGVFTMDSTPYFYVAAHYGNGSIIVSDIYPTQNWVFRKQTPEQKEELLIATLVSLAKYSASIGSRVFDFRLNIKSTLLGKIVRRLTVLSKETHNTKNITELVIPARQIIYQYIKDELAIVNPNLEITTDHANTRLNIQSAVLTKGERDYRFYVTLANYMEACVDGIAPSEGYPIQFLIHNENGKTSPRIHLEGFDSQVFNNIKQTLL